MTNKHILTIIAAITLFVIAIFGYKKYERQQRINELLEEINGNYIKIDLINNNKIKVYE